MSVAIITGAGGLIGAEAARFFSRKGLVVVGIDNDMRARFFGPSASTRWSAVTLKRNLPFYTHIEADIRDADAMEKVFARYGRNIALVVHAAAQPSHDWAAREPLTDFTVNANGTLILLDAAVVGTRQTAAAQAAGLHIEVAPIFLHHDVGSDLRSAKQRVLRLINPHGLLYAVVVLGTGILPPRFGLDERQLVGCVAVNLVCGHMDKRRSRHKAVRRLQEVDRTYGVRIKVLERYLRGQIVTRLRCTVHDGRRTHVID